MDVCDLGIATLHTRVESWECDFNGHWNTRFYGRSFQLAAEAVAARFGATGSSPALPRVRHIRLHQELFASDIVEVRSAALQPGGSAAGAAVVHLLLSNGVLAATALDYTAAIYRLPTVSADQVLFALPRGIDGEPISRHSEPDAVSSTVEFGPVRPAKLDHAGELLFEEVIRLGSVASSVQLDQIGFTPAYSEENSVVRVAAELRVTRHDSPPAGTLLLGHSWFSHVREKSFRTNHCIMTIDGDIVAVLEICQVTVDEKTRKAVRVPVIVLEAQDI